jgi:general stress protein CsbA
MRLRDYITLVVKIIKYNLKIIFAGKFFWFLLSAFAFFAFFVFQLAWNRGEINEGAIYDMLFFPCLLLIFYPVVFGIQNDEDSRILEIIFGIPNYRYKVWGLRMLMVYVANYFILIFFAYIAFLLLYPVNVFEMAAQLIFPMLFFGNLAFMFSTITRSGNGTAVIMIILGLAFFIFTNANNSLRNTFWNVFLDPFSIPRDIHPMIWQNTVIKSRLFLLIGGIVCLMIGLLNLQKREKFV